MVWLKAVSKKGMKDDSYMFALRSWMEVVSFIENKAFAGSLVGSKLKVFFGAY